MNDNLQLQLSDIIHLILYLEKICTWLSTKNISKSICCTLRDILPEFNCSSSLYPSSRQIFPLQKLSQNSVKQVLYSAKICISHVIFSYPKG